MAFSKVQSRQDLSLRNMATFDEIAAFDASFFFDEQVRSRQVGSAAENIVRGSMGMYGKRRPKGLERWQHRLLRRPLRRYKSGEVLKIYMVLMVTGLAGYGCQRGTKCWLISNPWFRILWY
jgi:hypothetical protein